MAIIYFGSPALAARPLRALIDAGEEVALVVTRPDARRGRGGGRTPSPVKAEALKAGIKVVEPRSMKDEAFLAALSSYRPEFLVVVAYGKLLPTEVLSIPSVAPINLHASLLPKYRGAAPINWAIIDGQSETGLSTMVMSEGLDEGDSLLTERITIDPEETTASLGQKMSELGGPLLVSTLKGLREGTIKPVAQEGEPSYARQLNKEDGRIDWEMGAVAICNRIRGMSPWPGAFCYISGKKLKVLVARPAQAQDQLPEAQVDAVEPGHVIEAGERMIVACGAGASCGGESVELLEVQPEGKRPMRAADFLRGRGLGVGLVLE